MKIHYPGAMVSELEFEVVSQGTLTSREGFDSISPKWEIMNAMLDRAGAISGTEARLVEIRKTPDDYKRRNFIERFRIAWWNDDLELSIEEISSTKDLVGAACIDASTSNHYLPDGIRFDPIGSEIRFSHPFQEVRPIGSSYVPVGGMRLDKPDLPENLPIVQTGKRLPGFIDFNDCEAAEDYWRQIIPTALGDLFYYPNQWRGGPTFFTTNFGDIWVGISNRDSGVVETIEYTDKRIGSGISELRLAESRLQAEMNDFVCLPSPPEY